MILPEHRPHCICRERGNAVTVGRWKGGREAQNGMISERILNGLAELHVEMLFQEKYSPLAHCQNSYAESCGSVKKHIYQLLQQWFWGPVNICPMIRAHCIPQMRKSRNPSSVKTNRKATKPQGQNLINPQTIAYSFVYKTEKQKDAVLTKVLLLWRKSVNIQPCQ